MNESIPFDEAIERLKAARRQVGKNLLLLVHSMEAEVAAKSPTRRENFKRMLVEIFSTMPEWNRVLADDMAYNITSCSRWWKADSCPHQALWPQLFTWFREKISRELLAD